MQILKWTARLIGFVPLVLYAIVFLGEIYEGISQYGIEINSTTISDTIKLCLVGLSGLIGLTGIILSWHHLLQAALMMILSAAIFAIVIPWPYGIPWLFPARFPAPHFSIFIKKAMRKNNYLLQ